MGLGFLFGLSMDYEVFILARMREAYDRTGSTVRAVVEGIGRTGRLVKSAALISLMGRGTWWLPRLPARVLRVEPSLPRELAAERTGS